MLNGRRGIVKLKLEILILRNVDLGETSNIAIAFYSNYNYTQITYEFRSDPYKLSDRIICIDYLDGTVVRRITLFWSFPSNKEAEKACDRIAELVANKKISQKLVSYTYTPKSEIKE